MTRYTLLIALFSLGCGDDDAVLDAGLPSSDAATLDTGPRLDAEMPFDGGTHDASPSDAEPGRDARPSRDAGTPDTAVPEEFLCTLVIGYSQVGQFGGGWFVAGGAFESEVDDARWQLRWNSGGGVDLWQSPDYAGWDRPIQSACDDVSEEPDRVLLSISGPYGESEDEWVAAIEATVAQIRLEHPSARQIILQPVVGGPGDATCTNDGEEVRASWQHKHIDAAIARVVGGDVVAGMSPEVRECSDYADDLGHLGRESATRIGREIGAYYAAADAR